MKIDQLIGSAKTIGITSHVRPDGDATGASLGMYLYIKKNYPDIKVHVFLEKVLLLRCIDFLGLHRRDVLMGLVLGVGRRGGVGLLDRSRHLYDGIGELVVPLREKLSFLVELYLEKQRGTRDRQDHVDKRMQSLIHFTSSSLVCFVETPETRLAAHG